VIDPSTVCIFVPPGLQKFKLDLFNRISAKIEAAGGKAIRGDYAAINLLPDEVIPIVGCTPQFKNFIKQWQQDGRNWIYWDRGYLRRVFATWLPKGSDMGIPGGYYRWHLNSFQMNEVRDVPSDRFSALKLDGVVKPWRRNGSKIVVAHTLPDYWNLRGLPEDWSYGVASELAKYTERQIVVRDKESKVPLDVELQDAWALVTHGSIAAVEAVIMGCPVFVDIESAAAVMGKTDISEIENPVYPDREKWLHSLAYCQFNEQELVDGTLWKLM